MEVDSLLTPPKAEVNISFPSEMIPYVDKLIASPRLHDLGINSRRKLGMVIIAILRERIEALPKRLRDKIELEINNVSMLEAYPEYLDKVTEMRIAKVLWLGYKTQILGTVVRSLLRETDPDYNKLASVLDISVEDIAKHVSEGKPATQKSRVM